MPGKCHSPTHAHRHLIVLTDTATLTKGVTFPKLAWSGASHAAARNIPDSGNLRDQSLGIALLSYALHVRCIVNHDEPTKFGGEWLR